MTTASAASPLAISVSGETLLVPRTEAAISQGLSATQVMACLICTPSTTWLAR
ncbi:hypothetical protein D3C83_178870 [compost metagenome]